MHVRPCNMQSAPRPQATAGRSPFSSPQLPRLDTAEPRAPSPAGRGKAPGWRLAAGGPGAAGCWRLAAGGWSWWLWLVGTGTPPPRTLPGARGRANGG
jgi:hypothetical protein